MDSSEDDAYAAKVRALVARLLLHDDASLGYPIAARTTEQLTFVWSGQDSFQGVLIIGAGRDDDGDRYVSVCKVSYDGVSATSKDGNLPEDYDEPKFVLFCGHELEILRDACNFALKERKAEPFGPSEGTRA